MVSYYNFTHPLCLSCGITLEHRQELDEAEGIIYEVTSCPSCGEVWRQPAVAANGRQ